MKKTKIDKTKNLVFNEKIDKAISGFALVFSFIIVGILLQFDNSFFGTATNFIKILFIVIGILGLLTEVKNLNTEYDIKGLDSIFIGAFLLMVLFLLKTYCNVENWFIGFKIIYQMILFFFILISIYGFSKGIIEMFYSLILNSKIKEGKNKAKLFSSIVVVLTQLSGLVLIGAQIYEIFAK